MRRPTGSEAGAEAVELAEQLHPDVVVMDINMPNMDGIETTKRIKRNWLDIAVIALSSTIGVYKAEDEGLWTTTHQSSLQVVWMLIVSTKRKTPCELSPRVLAV